MPDAVEGPTIPRDPSTRHGFLLCMSQWVPQPPAAVFPFFAEPRNLERITPPWLHFAIERVSPGPFGPGTEIDYRLRLHGLPLRWRTRIQAWQPPDGFSDRQLSGPYAEWLHEHTFQPRDGGTLLGDEVRFRLPGGWAGRIAASWLVRRDLIRIFAYRSSVISAHYGGLRQGIGGQPD